MKISYVLLLAFFAIMVATSTSASAVTQDELYQSQLKKFELKLENYILERHERFQREIRAPPSIRSRHKRAASDVKLRHSFISGTNAGNREKAVITGSTWIPSHEVHRRVAYWHHFDYKRLDFLITYLLDEDRFVIYRFNTSGDYQISDHLREVATSSVLVDILNVFGIPQSSHPVDRYDAMLIATAAYGKDTICIFTFYGGKTDTDYTLQLNQTLTLSDVQDIESFYIDDELYLAFARASNASYTGDGIYSYIYKWNVNRKAFVFYEQIFTHQPAQVKAIEMERNTYLIFVETSNSSTVWKYNIKQRQFMKYQSLIAAGYCGLVEAFVVAYDHYIVLNNVQKNESLIYIWDGHAFNQFQTITSGYINSWNAISLPNCQAGTFLFLSHGLVDTMMKLYFYDFKEDRFIAENDTKHFTNATLSPFQSVSMQIFVGVSGKNVDLYVKLHELHIVVEQIADPVMAETRKLDRHLATLQNAMDSLENNLQHAESNLDDAVRLDGDQVINGTIFFASHVTVNDLLIIQTIEVPNVVHSGNVPEGKDSLPYLADNVTMHDLTIKHINNTLNNTVSLDTSQTVYGNKTFWNASFDDLLTTNHLTADIINDVWIENLNENAVRLDRPNQVINGTLTLMDILRVTADVNLLDGNTINDIDLDQEGLESDKENSVIGVKTFLQDVYFTGNVTLGNEAFINGIDPSDDIITLTGNHTINGMLNFTDGIHLHNNLDVIGTVDGVDVSTFAPDVATTIANQTIQGSVTFENTPRFSDDIIITGLVNGYDISDLANKTVRLDENATITGRKSFVSNVTLRLEGDLEVEQLIDRVNFSEIITKTGFFEVAGEKTFVGGLVVEGAIHVGKTVDGIDLSEEAVTLTKNHSITSSKIFLSGVAFGNDVTTGGTVDGVNLAALADDIITQSTNQTIRGPVTFKNTTVFESDLIVSDLINGVNLTFLADDAVMTDSIDDQEISGKKIFQDNVTLSSGFINIHGLFNGYNVTTDFLDKFRDQEISGNLAFADGFTVNSNTTIGGLIDGVDILSLYNSAVLTWRDADITGHKVLAGDVSIEGSLEVGEEVNDVDFSEDLMLVNVEQNITGEMTFNDVYVDSDVQVGNLTVLALNGRNWSEVVDNRITLTTDQYITGYHIFNNTATVKGDLSTEELINGFNLTALSLNIMSKTKDQVITGFKNFTGEFYSKENVIFRDTVDGVNLTDLIDRAVRLSGDNEITGEKVFKESVHIEGNLEVEGLINGNNLTFLAKDAVWRDENPHFITADKTFVDGFHANEDVDVGGFVNGINISEEVVTLSTNQKLYGNYTFEKGISVEDNIEVVGLLNGVNVTYLNLSAVRIDRDDNVNGHIIFTDDVTADYHVNVTGHTDGVDISELQKKAFSLTEPFEFTGATTFAGPVTFLDDVDLVGTCDGHDLGEWAALVVKVDEVQNITGNITFTGTVIFDNPIKADDVEFETTFGYNFSEWLMDVVFLDEDRNITGEKTFTGAVTVEGDVIVNGTVDGIHVAEEVVTLREDQVITGKKTFSSMFQSEDDVTVSGLVNGVDLIQSAGDTFMLDKSQNVTATKTFLAPCQIMGHVYVMGELNGTDIINLVTLHDDQYINGILLFDGETKFTNDLVVFDLVSGYNLTEISIRRVTLSGEEVIYGPLNFVGNVTFGEDAVTDSLVDRVHLLDLQRAWTASVEDVDNDVVELKWIADGQCDAIDDLQDDYGNAFVDLDYFQQIQVIPSYAQSIETFTYDGDSYLAMAVYAKNHVESCVNSTIWKWNTTDKQFNEIASVPTDGARKWIAFQFDDTQYLAVANSGEHGCDSSNTTTSSIYTFDGYSVSLFQSITAPSMSDVESFMLNGEQYLIFVSSDETSLIYEFEEDEDYFENVQNISIAGGASGVEFITIGNSSFLAFARSLSETGLIFMYNEEHENFTLFQSITTYYSFDVSYLNYHGNMGLMFAAYAQSAENGRITFDTESRIFLWSEDTEMFELSEHSIPSQLACDVGFFTLGLNSYITLVTHNDYLQLFRYEGVGKFQSAFTLGFYGIQSVKVFTMGSSNDIYLAVSVDSHFNLDISVRILKGVLKGALFNEIDDLCELTYDEPYFHDPKM